MICSLHTLTHTWNKAHSPTLGLRKARTWDKWQLSPLLPLLQFRTPPPHPTSHWIVDGPLSEAGCRETLKVGREVQAMRGG